MAEHRQERAMARLEEALRAAGALDPRGPYREALRVLKERRPEGFQEALRYYENVLLARLAEADREPLAEWLAYGRRITELEGKGETFRIDASGRAEPAPAPPDPTSAARAGELFVFLPDDNALPAVFLAGPAQLTAAQQANVELLVYRKLHR